MAFWPFSLGQKAQKIFFGPFLRWKSVTLIFLLFIFTEQPYMTVVQGQSMAITSTLLFTEDPDTPPNELSYDVMKAPAFGQLVLADNLSNPLMRFTQADINHQRVVYFHHDGGPSTDFYFRVSDGKYSPVYRYVLFLLVNNRYLPGVLG